MSVFPDPENLSESEHAQATDRIYADYLAGRLSMPEYEQLTDQVAKAASQTDLAAILALLPSAAPATPTEYELFTPEVPAGPDFDLEVVTEKGRKVDRYDNLIFTITVAAFLLTQFVLHLPHAWLTFVAGFVAAAIVRFAFDFNQAEEGKYLQLRQESAGHSEIEADQDPELPR